MQDVLKSVDALHQTVVKASKKRNLSSSVWFAIKIQQMLQQLIDYYWIRRLCWTAILNFSSKKLKLPLQF